MGKLTKAERVREWFKDWPLPVEIADCRECAKSLGIDEKYVWIVARHEMSIEQRQAYYASYHRKRYETDPDYLQRKREQARKFSARRRASNAEATA